MILNLVLLTVSRSLQSSAWQHNSAGSLIWGSNHYKGDLFLFIISRSIIKSLYYFVRSNSQFSTLSNNQNNGFRLASTVPSSWKFQKQNRAAVFNFKKRSTYQQKKTKKVQNTYHLKTPQICSSSKTHWTKK